MTPLTQFYQNSQPKQSTDNICIEPINKSTTSVQNGKSLEVCCLYCNKVYESGPSLKRQIKKCKERREDLNKQEPLVIDPPPTKNNTVDMTKEYTWSQNGRNISSSTIDCIYNKIVFLA